MLHTKAASGDLLVPIHLYLWPRSVMDVVSHRLCFAISPSLSRPTSLNRAERPVWHPNAHTSFVPAFLPRYTEKPNSIPCFNLINGRTWKQRPAAACAASDLASSSDRAFALPWKKSIGGDNVDLLFMPFIEHQLQVMRSELPDLVDLPFEKDLSYQESNLRPARIESWQWKSDLFRKVRATYIDAGAAAQVFNSVWYPDPKYDMPLLGIDFLSFGKKKIICVLDFQPLLQSDEYLKKYCEPINYIRLKYEGLAGSMSARFYDENKFFSKQLALATFSDATPVASQLLPAFKEYLRDYIAMIKKESPNDDLAAIKHIRNLQKEYDQYSAERDPAVGLFSTYWGKEWAEKFTYEFLFSDAVPVEKSHAS